jgi:pyruvate/2-oxoglutarate dehydrogenase complex dihydrolipoamide dehydrogenase (E3) component
VDQILLAMGRKPATGGINLDAAAIAAHKGKIVVNDRMQTSQPHIFAAGDVCSPLDVVHLAIQQGEIAARNAHSLLNNKTADETIDYRLQLFGVFSHPQVACVGATTEKLNKDGIPFLSASYPFNDHGKSILMEANYGYVKIIAEPKRGRILGAEIVGKDAGELIHAFSGPLAMRATVFDLLRAPWYHPTLAEIITYPLEEIAELVSRK